MKNITITFTILIAIIFISCSATKQIPYQRNGMVEYLSSNGSNITVSSRGVAENENKAVYHAELNALENILFRGIPNSNQENPMIENENTANKTTLNKFINSGDFKLYLISSYVMESHKNGKSYDVLQEVTYDMTALRKRLEKEGLIRKLGL